MEMNYDEKLVEYAVKLTYKIARKIQLENDYSYDMYIEFASIGLIGATKALQSFDPNKGFTFGTFASRCIYNEIFMTLRKKEFTSTSLDELINEDEDKRTVGDMCHSPLDDIERRVICMNILELIDNNKHDLFTKKELFVYDLIRYNPELKQREIASIVGNTRSYTSRLLKNIRRKMYKLISKHGYYNIF